MSFTDKKKAFDDFHGNKTVRIIDGKAGSRREYGHCGGLKRN